MREIAIAVTQMECGWDRAENHAQAEALVRRAAAEGADVVLLQELFETPYFCPDMNRDYFELARPLTTTP